MLTTVLRDPITLTRSRMLWIRGLRKANTTAAAIALSTDHQFVHMLGGGRREDLAKPWDWMCMDARNWSLPQKQHASAKILDKFSLVGRTTNLTSFSQQLLALMGRDLSDPFALPTTNKHKTTGHLSEQDESLMEHMLSSPNTIDRWIYDQYASPTGLPSGAGHKQGE